MNPNKIIIAGAAGRDFHDFNTFFRHDPRYEVIAFTATQDDRQITREIDDRGRLIATITAINN